MILYYGRYAYNKVYENKLKYIWQIFKECNKLMYVCIYVNAKVWGGNELFYTKFIIRIVSLILVFIGKLLHIIFSTLPITVNGFVVDNNVKHKRKLW